MADADEIQYQVSELGAENASLEAKLTATNEIFDNLYQHFSQKLKEESTLLQAALNQVTTTLPDCSNRDPRQSTSTPANSQDGSLTKTTEQLAQASLKKSPSSEAAILLALERNKNRMLKERICVRSKQSAEIIRKMLVKAEEQQALLTLVQWHNRAGEDDSEVATPISGRLVACCRCLKDKKEENTSNETFVKLSTCGHDLCSRCVDDMLANMFERYRLPCHCPKCLGEIVFHDIKSFLNPDHHEEYSRLTEIPPSMLRKSTTTQKSSRPDST